MPLLPEGPGLALTCDVPRAREALLQFTRGAAVRPVVFVVSARVAVAKSSCHASRGSIWPGCCCCCCGTLLLSTASCSSSCRPSSSSVFFFFSLFCCALRTGCCRRVHLHRAPWHDVVLHQEVRLIAVLHSQSFPLTLSSSSPTSRDTSAAVAELEQNLLDSADHLVAQLEPLVASATGSQANLDVRHDTQRFLAARASMLDQLTYVSSDC